MFKTKMKHPVCATMYSFLLLLFVLTQKQENKFVNIVNILYTNPIRSFIVLKYDYFNFTREIEVKNRLVDVIVTWQWNIFPENWLKFYRLSFLWFENETWWKKYLLQKNKVMNINVYEYFNMDMVEVMVEVMGE